MKQTALVVVSEPRTRRLLGSTLNPQHWFVAEECSVTDAAGILASVNVDLLLIDLSQFESRDVLRLCQSTRRALGQEQTRIVALVNPGEIDKVNKDVRRQIDASFSKPFSPIALLDWVYATFHEQGQSPGRSSRGVA